MVECLNFKPLFVVYAGSKSLASEKEFRKDLYPDIEPYSTGMLKVSDLHLLYWEQCGNPEGRVSD